MIEPRTNGSGLESNETTSKIKREVQSQSDNDELRAQLRAYILQERTMEKSKNSKRKFHIRKICIT